MTVHEYKYTSDEFADATLDFMKSRPVTKIIIMLMYSLCGASLLVFMYKLYKMEINSSIITPAFATIWLFYGKKINHFLICNIFKKKKAENIIFKFSFNPKYIDFFISNNMPIHTKWEQIKYIIKNKKGIIIPLTGIAGKGKFLWLPFRILQKEDIDSLLSIIRNKKICIKTK